MTDQNRNGEAGRCCFAGCLFSGDRENIQNVYKSEKKENRNVVLFGFRAHLRASITMSPCLSSSSLPVDSVEWNILEITREYIFDGNDPDIARNERKKEISMSDE